MTDATAMSDDVNIEDHLKAIDSRLEELNTHIDRRAFGRPLEQRTATALAGGLERDRGSGPQAA